MTIFQVMCYPLCQGGHGFDSHQRLYSVALQTSKNLCLLGNENIFKDFFKVIDTIEFAGASRKLFPKKRFETAAFS